MIFELGGVSRDVRLSDTASALLESPGSLSIRRVLHPNDLEGVSVSIEMPLQEGGTAHGKAGHEQHAAA